MEQKDITNAIRNMLDDFSYDYEHTHSIYGDGSRVIAEQSEVQCALEFKEMVQNALNEVIGG